MMLRGPKNWGLVTERDEAWGWVVCSIPWRGRRFGLTVLTDGRWFLGSFTKVASAACRKAKTEVFI